MSDDRRQQRRRERQRLRRNQPRAYQPGGTSSNIEFPGLFGWVQRNGRWFGLAAIVVMVLSLSSAFLFSQTGSNNDDDIPTPTPQPSASATGTATGTATATATAQNIQRRYSAAPPMQIDTNKTYEALIRTEKGDIRVQLLPEASPQHVNNFVFLARNRFFEGLTFHRVIPGFVAQGGDPAGNGTGGPGYTLPPENNDLPLEAGVISMASSPAGVSGSQFFITLQPTPQLNENFGVFGRVVEGMDVARALTARDPQQRNQPIPDRILKVEIIEKER